MYIFVSNSALDIYFVMQAHYYYTEELA